MRTIEVAENSIDTILEDLLQRSPNNYTEYENTVKDILSDIKENKDEAVFRYTKQFDKADITSANVEVTEAEIAQA